MLIVSKRIMMIFYLQAIISLRFHPTGKVVRVGLVTLATVICSCCCGDSALGAKQEKNLTFLWVIFCQGMLFSFCYPVKIAM